MEVYSEPRKRGYKDCEIRDRKKDDCVWQGGDWVGSEAILGSLTDYPVS